MVKILAFIYECRTISAFTYAKINWKYLNGLLKDLTQNMSNENIIKVISLLFTFAWSRFIESLKKYYRIKIRIKFKGRKLMLFLLV